MSVDCQFIRTFTRCEENGYAVGAFNVSNMENIQCVLEAAEELQSPVLVQGAQSVVDYADGECFVEMIKAIAQHKKGAIGIHYLDHCAYIDFEIMYSLRFYR